MNDTANDNTNPKPTEKAPETVQPTAANTTIPQLEQIIMNITNGNLEVAFGLLTVVTERIKQRYIVAVIQPTIIAEFEQHRIAIEKLNEMNKDAKEKA